MGLKIITPPAVEPIVLTDVEAQARASLTAESTIVGVYCKAVRQQAETLTRRALITQTWELVLNSFPRWEPNNTERAIILPMPPLASVTSIKYIDLDGVEQTLDASTYTVDTDSEPGRVIPAHGLSWPTPRTQVNAVRVRFVCGYGATAASVPEAVRTWMLLNIANLYENRQTIHVGEGRVVDLPTLADSLLDCYRMRGF